MKTFKKLVLVALLLFCGGVTEQARGQAMIFVAPDTFNFNFYAVLDSFFAQNPVDTAEGGNYREFERLGQRWSERLSPHGDFSQAALAMAEYTADFQNGVACTQNSSVYSPNWINLGPTNTPVVGSNSTGMGQIHRLAFHPNYNNGSQTVYAGTAYGGLWRSYDSGDHWHQVNTDIGIPVSSVSGIALHPTDSNIIIISTGDADQGLTRGSNAPYLSSGNSGTIAFVQTGGVYRTTDGGASWEGINGSVIGTPYSLLSYFTRYGTIQQLIMNPQNPDQIFIATSKGVFRSNNALGTSPTWKKVLTESWINSVDSTQGGIHQFRGLAFKPDDPDVVYASGVQIYRSTDGGDTWETIGISADYTNDTDCYPTHTGVCWFPQALAFNDTMLLRMDTLNFLPARINITTSITAPDNLYAYAYGIKNGSSAIYIFQYTPQSGWTSRYFSNSTSTTEALTGSRLGIAVHPNRPNEIFLGTTKVYRTSPTTVISPYSGSGFHADVHELIFPPNDTSGSLLFCGNDGGVSIKNIATNPTSDGGWTYKHNGLAVSKSWGFDDWEKEGNVLAAANQDASVNISTDGGLTWAENSWGGDGYGVQIDNVTGRAFVNNNHALRYQNYLSVTNEYDTARPYTLPINPFTGNTVNVLYSADESLTNALYTDSLYIGFNELYKIKQSPPSSTSHYEVSSNISRLLNSSSLIKNVAFAEDNPNKIYLTTFAHVQNGYSGLWGAGFPHLFKTTTGGIKGDWNDTTAWEDLKTYLPKTYIEGWSGPLATLPVTGIALDPNNSDRIWLSFTGYVDTMKVWKSEDGGYTWTNADPNGTLCNFPVNNIVYQPGTNDRLYIGTDVGVFVRNTSTGDWEKYGDFPHVRVMGLKINSCLGKLRTATFGRGVWEGDLLPRENDFGQEIVVNSNRTWDYERVLTNNIRVKNNSTLTITNTVNMPKHGYIYIEPGSKLIVDGGTITNACGEFWNGIIVKGQSQYGQSPSLQGSVELTDALIEHSKYGIQVHDGYLSLSSGGGIVSAENTTFRNNWRSVEYSRYHYMNPLVGQELHNTGYFKNCTFTIDSNLHDFQTTKPFLGHISMWDVMGVAVFGCTFENRYPSFATAQDAGYGILTIDAGFNAYHLCSGVGCPSYDTTTFYRLYDGIRVSSYGTRTYAPIIDRCLFKDCHYGVFNDGVFNLEIARSNFEVGGFPKQRTGTPNIHEGTVTHHAQGFIVTQNHFTNSASNPTSAVRLGTRAVDLGTISNEIYKNELDAIQFGHLANGTNASSTSLSGFKYRCNEHNDSWSDITAYGGTINDRDVLALHQGSTAAPAGNIFDTPVAYNINNYDSAYQSMITYFYYSGNSSENPSVIRNILESPTANQNGCISQLSDTATTTGTTVSNGLSTAERAALISAFSDASDNFGSELSVLNASIDNDDTPGLLEQVEMADEGNAGTVAGDLQNFSPWISQGVLQAMIDNTAFDVADMMDVLEQNPDVLRIAGFMAYVVESGRFSAPKIDSLYQAALTVTARTEQESKVAYYNGLKFNYAYRIIRDNLNDTSGVDVDSIDYWLQQIPSLETEYLRVALYKQADDWSTAGSILENIPNNYTLSDSQQVAYDDYQTLHQLLSNLKDEERSIMELDSTEYSTVLTLAEKGWMPAHVQAQSILNFAYDANYRRPALFPEEVESKPLFPQEAATEELMPRIADASRASIRIQPNPAREWLLLGYSFPEGESEGMLRISDTYGRVVYTQNVKSEQPDLFINTAAWSAGTYFAQLEGKGWKAKTIRFVVVK